MTPFRDETIKEMTQQIEKINLAISDLSPETYLEVADIRLHLAQLHGTFLGVIKFYEENPEYKK